MDPFRLGEWLVFPDLDRVVRDDVVHHVEPKIMDVLVLLASRPGHVFPRADIIDAVWAKKFIGESALSRAVAAAWAIVLDSLFGASAAWFHEWAPGAPDERSIRRSEHSLAPTLARREWLDEFDRRRRQAQPSPAGEEADHALVADAAGSGPRPPFPFTIGAQAGPGPAFVARFSAADFDPGLVEALLDCALRAFAGLSGHPGEPVAGIDILGEAQRRRLLDDWNPPSRERSAREGVTTVFARRVAEGGDRVAVEWDAGTLSYRELDRRSSALARRLLARGPCAGAAIGVALERSPESIVALLGILKAGAAYLPVDLNKAPTMKKGNAIIRIGHAMQSRTISMFSASHAPGSKPWFSHTRTSRLGRYLR